jgi:hypothetical protein
MRAAMSSQYAVPDRKKRGGTPRSRVSLAWFPATSSYTSRDGRGALAAEAELRAATARVVRARLGLAGAEAAG